MYVQPQKLSNTQVAPLMLGISHDTNMNSAWNQREPLQRQMDNENNKQCKNKSLLVLWWHRRARITWKGHPSTTNTSNE